jgi:hypothetical protein
MQKNIDNRSTHFESRLFFMVTLHLMTIVVLFTFFTIGLTFFLPFFTDIDVP